MNFTKTSLLTAFSQSIRIISTFAVNKLISINVGPSGIAVLGQFRDIYSIVVGISSSPNTTGLVKYAAEYKKDQGKLRALVSTSLILTIGISIIISLSLVLFGSFIIKLVYDYHDLKSLFTIFSSLLIFITLNEYIKSFTNGIREIATFTKINIAQSIINLTIAILLVYLYNLWGAILALLLTPFLTFIFSIFYYNKNNYLKKYKLNVKNIIIKKPIIKELLKFSLLSVTALVTKPVGLIYLRNNISSDFSIYEVGLWESIWRLYLIIFSFINTLINVYYIPKISELESKPTIKFEITFGLKRVIPILLILVTILYFLRDKIILLLYSRDFIESEKYVFSMCIFLIIQVVGLFLGSILRAKAYRKVSILRALVLNLGFPLLAIILANYYNSILMINYAFIIISLINILFLLIYLRKYLFF